MISLLQLGWKGITLSRLWWGLTGESFSPFMDQNLTTDLLGLQCECLFALPRHLSAVLISHQTWRFTCSWVWGQLWLPPALTCIVLTLLIFYSSHLLSFSSFTLNVSFCAHLFQKEGAAVGLKLHPTLEGAEWKRGLTPMAAAMWPQVRNEDIAKWWNRE